MSKIILKKGALLSRRAEETSHYLAKAIEVVITEDERGVHATYKAEVLERTCSAWKPEDAIETLKASLVMEYKLLRCEADMEVLSDYNRPAYEHLCSIVEAREEGWKKLIGVDFPDMLPVTRATIDATVEHAQQPKHFE